MTSGRSDNGTPANKPMKPQANKAAAAYQRHPTGCLTNGFTNTP